MVKLLLVQRTNLIAAPSVPEVVQPQTDQQEQENPGNDSGQSALDRSRPQTPNWTGFSLPRSQREWQKSTWSRRRVKSPNISKTVEPLIIDHNLYLDYRSPQSIKFFNKGRERLPGDPFYGKNIFSWLKRLEIKANEFQWIPTLTIDGKLLTTNFAELSMDTVKKAAQEFQNEAQRKAQNSRMLF